MTHLFGPVASRRLGQSLGIDVLPFKTCPFDCVYCECGATTDLTMRRGDYVKPADILAELEAYLAANPAPDCLTFSGSGEPTLYAGLGVLARAIKARWPAFRLVLLTNSALLFDPLVRAECLAFDLVLPSLDAMFQDSYERINRPVAGLRADDVLAGLLAFRAAFKGELWLELFIVPGINDSAEELAAFRDALVRLAPTRVQLNSLDRPGTEGWVRPATKEEMARVRDALGIGNIEIVSRRFLEATTTLPVGELEQRILGTLVRRPCTLADLESLTGYRRDLLEPLLRELVTRGLAVATPQGDLVFYRQPA